MDLSSVLYESMMDGFLPVLTTYILPIGLWMLVPAVMLRLIFKSQLSFQVGALIGLALCFFIGPFST
ncbi:hypothetical protein [Planomicrobium sp. Y74]|uniref:hypothetical protein n=1 Tax=Planomicrobium sp. Y74 TaxID=2478977 RepID=UPI000EF4D737|nr:hypothetical protein [Planomicrobium sp. Y74]RLQ91503.1 hypothetical protein D9754_07190 [Planomicrobium sp. Y74]